MRGRNSEIACLEKGRKPLSELGKATDVPVPKTVL